MASESLDDDVMFNGGWRDGLAGRVALSHDPEYVAGHGVGKAEHEALAAAALARGYSAARREVATAIADNINARGAL